MFEPGDYSEQETLVGYLDEQLQAIRNAAHGLTDDQARATPCRSALSVGGLIKHATYVLRQREWQRDHAGEMPDRAATERFGASFALTDEESLAEVVQDFDTAREAYLEDVRRTDPAADRLEPPAPWFGRPSPTASVERFALVHHVEELARHAGHADIVREQIDGATAASLALAVEGREGNAFIQPWRPSE